MATSELHDRVTGWLAGRLPQEWQHQPPQITVDRDEITVALHLPDVALSDDAGDAVRSEARAGRARAFREETREARIRLARETEHRFERKVSWAVTLGEGDDAHYELFTHLAVPVMTRLRQPQRRVLDTLVDAGVARSRADALAWCVRLVGRHEHDWLAELREAMGAVNAVRERGPAA